MVVAAHIPAPRTGAVGRDALGRTALAIVKLPGLMERSAGAASVPIALVDGPVATDHPDLSEASIRAVGGGPEAVCTVHQSSACDHGTFVAGILAAKRGSRAPAICPRCTLLARPIFHEAANKGRLPTATPNEVADAIVDAVRAGARILNLSAATGEPSTRTERRLSEALDYAARSGVVVVAAAGNQATLGSSAITRHPWVIPVVAYDRRGQPMGASNLGSSIGRRGLGAPGHAIESLGPEGGMRIGGGTSSAAAFVTGAIGLLSSLYPKASATALRRAVAGGGPRRTVTPPLLNAEAALEAMERMFGTPGLG